MDHITPNRHINDGYDVIATSSQQEKEAALRQANKYILTDYTIIYPKLTSELLSFQKLIVVSAGINSKNTQNVP